MRRRVAYMAIVAVITAAALTLVAPAGSANECDGLQVCIPVAGPWVVVPTAAGSSRPQASWQLTCPRGHIVGGLDARLSQRAIDVSFLGTLGSPVNPGITTSRSVTFLGVYVGASPRSPTFKPFVGCMPTSGGGSRVPTSAGAFAPGTPTTRHATTARVRPGSATVTVACRAGERLVGASHAFGFFTRTPPEASLASSVRGTQSVQNGAVVVGVRGDAEVGAVRAVVQVQAVCARTR
jgi:hypothetical protein